MDHQNCEHYWEGTFWAKILGDLVNFLYDAETIFVSFFNQVASIFHLEREIFLGLPKMITVFTRAQTGLSKSAPRQNQRMWEFSLEMNLLSLKQFLTQFLEHRGQCSVDRLFCAIWNRLSSDHGAIFLFLLFHFCKP